MQDSQKPDLQTEYPFISVIVPIYNEIGYIRSFLQSLSEFDYPRHRVEYLLVDGGSSDGTVQAIQDFRPDGLELRLLDNPDRYVPQALNLGLSKARGSVIVRLDVHALYPRDYLTSLVFWLARTEADNVGGLWETKPGGPGMKAKAIARALSSPFGVGNAYYRIGTSQPMSVDTVPFGCYRRDVFDRIGPFDPHLLRNQDDEFNARLIKKGGRIMLIPTIKISYFARTGFLPLARMMNQYGYFKPLVNVKIGRPASLRQFAPPVLILALLFLLVSSLFFKAGIYAFLGLLFLYLGFVFLGSFKSGSQGGREMILTCLAMPVMHFPYAAGYLIGAINHLILRKNNTKENLSSSR